MERNPFIVALRAEFLLLETSQQVAADEVVVVDLPKWSSFSRSSLIRYLLWQIYSDKVSAVVDLPWWSSFSRRSSLIRYLLWQIFSDKVSAVVDPLWWRGCCGRSSLMTWLLWQILWHIYLEPPPPSPPLLPSLLPARCQSPEKIRAREREIERWLDGWSCFDSRTIIMSRNSSIQIIRCIMLEIHTVHCTVGWPKFRLAWQDFC